MKKFIIDHIDPLGQGVYKKDDQIFFIPKTLPGESGSFKVIKSNKGVNFGQVHEISTFNPSRIDPTCPHFNDCSGCQYLHTSYEKEIEFKVNAYQKLLNQMQLLDAKIETILSDKRLHYRNRIQLHYDLKQNKIGFKRAKSNEIIEIPNCQIMDDQVQIAFDKIIAHWQVLAKKQKKTKGHVEIYNTSDGVIISWNKAYAEGGFSQVNQPTNNKLLSKISELFSKEDLTVLDLFGGKGNLSEKLNYKYRSCVDIYENKQNVEFVNLNLFQDDALKTFKSINSNPFEIMIIDPPRSGFKNIKKWVDHFQPKSILYVSCHPATMARDLNLISKEYKARDIFLIDLFPSTYHYESMILLEKECQ